MFAKIYWQLKTYLFLIMIIFSLIKHHLPLKYPQFYRKLCQIEAIKTLFKADWCSLTYFPANLPSHLHRFLTHLVHINSFLLLSMSLVVFYLEITFFIGFTFRFRSYFDFHLQTTDCPILDQSCHRFHQSLTSFAFDSWVFVALA